MNHSFVLYNKYVAHNSQNVLYEQIRNQICVLFAMQAYQYQALSTTLYSRTCLNVERAIRLYNFVFTQRSDNVDNIGIIWLYSMYVPYVKLIKYSYTGHDAPSKMRWTMTAQQQIFPSAGINHVPVVVRSVHTRVGERL